MTTSSQIHSAFEQGRGIFRLAPNWVPRAINQAGGRLRLHPDDYFALGMQRTSIKERWFSSTVPALNGPLAPDDEGMSYVAPTERSEDKFLFKDAVDELGADLFGHDLKEKYGTWPMYSKFFDYKLALFHHLHLDDAAANRLGRLGKPEAYYFPVQMNSYVGEFPVTYFGFDPDVTREQVRERLLTFDLRDNRITELSRAYRLELGSGWYTPPGVVHAPGSLLTYEPQWNSDVGEVFENMMGGEIVTGAQLKSQSEREQRADYLLSLLDWQKNVDPHYMKTYFRAPIPCPAVDERYQEKWISYANPYIGAKELTVMPGQTVVVKGAVAYGCIIIQGHGQFGVYDAEAASMLRFGQLSADEYFVGEQAARDGVRIVNHSRWEPMVILKHFGPNDPDMPQTAPAM
jgi:hypothetical protein